MWKLTFSHQIKLLYYVKKINKCIFEIRVVQCRISDRIHLEIQIPGNFGLDELRHESDPIRNFRISKLFRSDHRVFGSDHRHRIFELGCWHFWKISIHIRSENLNFFPDIRSEISEILKSDRIGGFLYRMIRIKYFWTTLFEI